jgi:5-bromo-4-chloroindolyl phosphate hydrolysis protein
LSGAKPSDSNNLVLAGGVSAVVLPSLVLGLGAPLWLGLIGAVAAFGGVAFLAQPNNLLEDFDPARIGKGQFATIRAVLTDALPALDRIEHAFPKIKARAMHDHAEKIAAAARRIVADLEKEPQRLSTVQRALTYYLPRAADIVDGYLALEQRGTRDAKRFVDMEAIAAKLVDAFEQFADKLLDDELRGLDADIKLVDEALQEDLGKPMGGKP